ncbi:MAG: WYL domain-containing protein [Leptolyngbyaceae cyanobacterium SU_3_3]|nr:WYL domain-containing protein [Leptolyngbyaceae cyanobacterium SU_3_3]
MVSPLGLVAKGSIWYLVAAAGAEVRSYRISRVQDATLMDAPLRSPGGLQSGRLLATIDSRIQSQFTLLSGDCAGRSRSDGLATLWRIFCSHRSN